MDYDFFKKYGSNPRSLADYRPLTNEEASEFLRLFNENYPEVVKTVDAEITKIKSDPGCRSLQSFFPFVGNKSWMGLEAGLRALEAHKKAGGSIWYIDMEGPLSITTEALRARMSGPTPSDLDKS